MSGVGALATTGLAGCGSDASTASTSTTPLPPDTVRCALVDYAFRPGTDEPLVIDAGTTVRFVWRSNGHNVVPTEKPAGADWTGEPELRSRGHTYDHEFTVPGTYHIVCEPHVNLGMVGDIVVTESGGAATTGGANDTRE
nr:plastocyanin/azurin family copper-binding protein [Halarchaeum solikamskense]